MKNALSVELRLAKKYALPIIGIVFLVVALFVVFSLIPLWTDWVSNNDYPDWENQATVLLRYQGLLDKIESGEQTAEEIGWDIDLLRFFLNTGTTQYDYLEFPKLLFRHPDNEPLACGFSVLEGGCFLVPVIGASLGTFLFALPHQNGYFRTAALSGAERKKVALAKIVLAVSLLAFVVILLSGISAYILTPYFGQKTLTAIPNGYNTPTIASLWGSRTLGLLLSGTLFFLVASLLGLTMKIAALCFALPVLIAGFFFILSNASAPSWGSYGQLDGPWGIVKLCLPLSSVMLVPSFGFSWVIGLFLGFWLLADFGLGSLLVFRLGRMRL